MIDYKNKFFREISLYITFIAFIILGWGIVSHFRYEIKPLYHSGLPTPECMNDLYKIQVVAKGSVSDYLRLKNNLQASPYRISRGNELDLFYYALVMATKYNYIDGYFDAYEVYNKQFKHGSKLYPIDAKDKLMLKYILMEGARKGNRKCIDQLRKDNK